VSRWNKSERDRKENMGSEGRHEDLLRKASDGLDVHGWSTCFATASRPGQFRCAACENYSTRWSVNWNPITRMLFPTFAHVIFVTIKSTATCKVVPLASTLCLSLCPTSKPAAYDCSPTKHMSREQIQINRHCYISTILVISLQKVTSK
jgi:hypothetical protein